MCDKDWFDTNKSGDGECVFIGINEECKSVGIRRVKIRMSDKIV